MKDNFFSNIKTKMSIGRLSLTILMLLIVVLGGTFAWLTFQSNQSALVLTIGEVNDAQITLTPYQITGTVTPVTGYTDGTYSDVIINKGSGNSTLLYYKINQLDTALRNVLQYKVVCGTDYKEVKTGYFKDFTSNTEYAVIWDENTELNTALNTASANRTTYQSNLLSSTCTNNGTNSSVNYRVYTWVNSTESDQSAIQGSELDMELNGSIGSVTITGSNVYGQTLTASITDYTSANNPSYSYQWYYNTTNSTSGGTAISGATSQNYKVGSGLAGKYIYVVVTVSEMGYTQRTYVDITDTANNTYADVEKAASTISKDAINITYPKGSAPISYTGDGAISCGFNGNGDVIESCGVDTKTVSLQLKYIPDSGTTTIKLSLAEGTDYKATEEVITVNISKGTLSGGTVTINGTSQYTQTLTASVTEPVEALYDVKSTTVDSYSYQWYYNTTNSTSGGTAISGATGQSYKIGSGLVGKYIYVVVTAKKEYYNNRSISDVTDKGNDIDPPTLYEDGRVEPVTATISLSSKSATYTGSAIRANDSTATYDTDKDGDEDDVTSVLTVTYTYYTDNTCSTKTPTTTGASSAGGAPINVGTYYVKATATSSNGDYTTATTTCTSSSNVTHIITPATVAVTWSGTSKTFNGSEQKPSATATGLGNDSITMTVSGGQTNYSSSAYTATATCGSVKRSGTTVTNGCNNYLFTDADETSGSTKVSTTFTIAKYSPKISVGSAASSIDIGKGSSFTATVTTQSYCGGAISVSRNNTNVGVSSEDANYAESVSITGITSSGSKTIYFKDTNANDYVTGDTILTVGFTPTDTANCNIPATKSHTVTVNKRTPEITLTDASVTYAGTTRTGEALVTNGDSTVTAKYDGTILTGLTYTYEYFSNASCSTSLGSAPKNAGTYYFKAKYTTTSSSIYATTYSNCATLGIGKASIGVTWTSGQTQFTYNGSGQAPELSSYSAIGVGSESVTFTRTTKTNVGESYTSVASCSKVSDAAGEITNGCNNYTVTNNTSYAFKIIKYTPTLKLNSDNGSTEVSSTTLDVYTTANIPAYVTTISACNGTLSGTSAAPSSVEMGSSISISSTDAYQVGYTTKGYSAGTAVTVKFVPSSTANCNTPAEKTYTVTVNRVNPTVSLGATTATYTGKPINSVGATATGKTLSSSSASITSTLNTADGTGDGFRYVYYTDNSCSTQVSSYTNSFENKTYDAGSAPSYVGTYYVKATSVQTSQYNSVSSGCSKMTISAYQMQLTLSPTSGTVDIGASGQFTASVKTIPACKVSGFTVIPTSSQYLVPQDFDFTFANTTLENTGSSEGTVSTTVTYSDKDTSDYVHSESVTITPGTDPVNCGINSATFTASTNKRTLTVTMPTLSSVTYNGTPQNPISGTVGASATYNGTAVTGLSYTYTYYTNNTCTTKASSYTYGGTTYAAGSVPIDAGTYYVQASFAGDSTYNSAVSSCTSSSNTSYKINKASVAVSWGSITSFTYSGKAQAPTVNSVSGVNGETVNFSRTTQTNANACGTTNPYTSTASCSSVTGGRAKCSNYTLTNNTKTFTIGPKSVYVIWGETGFTYNGTSQAPTASIDTTSTDSEEGNEGNMVYGESMTVTVGGAQTNASNYTATASCGSVNGDPAKCCNYTLVNSDGSDPENEFTISKASCTCSITSTPTLEYPSNTSSVTGSTTGTLSYKCVYDYNGTTTVPGTRTINASSTYMTVGTVGTTSTVLTAKLHNADGTSVTVSQAAGTNNLACTTASTTVKINPSKYTISFDVNGGYSGTAPSSVTKTYGTSLTLSSTKPRWFGHTFTGWNTKADGTGTAYAAGGTMGNEVTANTTLYAQWSEITNYAVLMSDTGASVGDTYLRSTLQRSQIASISFVAGLENANSTATNADEGDTGSIKMWYVASSTSGLYDVYIGSNTDVTKFPSQSNRLFGTMPNLTSINFIDDTYNTDYVTIDTSSVTDMSYMFAGTSTISSLDLSNFNASSVTTMSNMFNGCSKLSSITFGSNFNTSSVTDMSMMFVYTTALTSLDLSSFNTSSVTNMSMMFGHTTALTSLDLSSFNTSSVTNMSSMFYISGLTSITFGSNFNTSSVTTMSRMFNGCTGLASLNVSGFNTSAVTDMSYMFSGCTGLTSLNVSNFNTSNVTTMNEMFSGCTKLTSLDLSSFNTSKLTDMTHMFYMSSGVKELDLSNFNTSLVTTMQTAFDGMSSLEKVTFGANFKFVGTNGYLPEQGNTYDINGVGTLSNRWYNNNNWVAYTPTQLATASNSGSIAGTYILKPLTVYYYNICTDACDVSDSIATSYAAWKYEDKSEAPNVLQYSAISGFSVPASLTGSQRGWSESGWASSPTSTSIFYSGDGAFRPEDLVNLDSYHLYSLYSRTVNFYSGPSASLTGSSTQFLNPSVCGGNYETCNNYSSISTPSATAISGRTFLGWQDSLKNIYGENTNEFIAPLSKNSLYAVYSATSDSSETTATFYYRNSLTGSLLSTTESIYYYSELNSCSVDNPGLSNLTDSSEFTAYGWRDDEDANTKEFSHTTVVIASCSTEYYGVYYRPIYFDDEYETQYYNVSGNLSQVAAPTLDAVTGWNSLGWKDDGSADDSDIIEPSTDVTIGLDDSTEYYSVYWREIEFRDGNIGNDGTVTQYYNSYSDEKSDIIAPADVEIDSYSTGYEAYGWTDSTSSLERAVEPGETIAGDDVVAVYYGLYKRDIPVYGGTPNSVSLFRNSYGAYSSSITLPSSCEELDGWDCTGFDVSTEADEQGYSPGTEISYSDVADAYYAEYRRGFRFNGGSPSTVNQYYNYAGNYSTLKTPSSCESVSGFTCIGFAYDTEAGSSDYGLSTTIPSTETDTEYYAVYSKLVSFENTTDNDLSNATQYYNYNGSYSLILPDVTYSQIDHEKSDFAGWVQCDDDSDCEIFTSPDQILSVGYDYTSNANYFIGVWGKDVTFYSGLNKSCTTNKPSYYTTWNERYMELPSSDEVCSAGDTYTFAGWSASEAATVPSISSSMTSRHEGAVDADTLIFSYNAVYSLDLGDITFYSGLASSTTEETVSRSGYYNTSGNTSGSTSSTITFPTITSISDWSISGWSSATNAGMGTIYSAGSSAEASATTYYAVYNRTATFYYGAAKASNSTATQYYNSYGDYTVTSPSTIGSLNSNWTAVGWTPSTTATSSTAYIGTNSTSSSSSSSFYALYERDIQFYSVSGSTTQVDDGTVTQHYNSYGTTETITTPTISSKPTNWTANGWRDDSTLSYREWGAGSSQTIPYTSGNTMYAVYNRNYTISFDGNGSTGGSTSSISAYCAYANPLNSTSARVYADVTATNGFTRTDYAFAGWNTKADGSGTSYGEDEFTLKKTVTYTTGTFGETWYAQWSINDTTGPTLSISAYEDGDAGATYTSDTWTNQDLTVVLSYEDNFYDFNAGPNFKTVAVNSTYVGEDTLSCTNGDTAYQCELDYPASDEFVGELCVVIEDDYGNASNAACITIKQDKTPPSCELSLQAGVGVIQGGTDPLSGLRCSGVGTSLSTAKAACYNGTYYTTCSDGTQYYGYVVDNAGNTSICDFTPTSCLA